MATHSIIGRFLAASGFPIATVLSGVCEAWFSAYVFEVDPKFAHARDILFWQFGPIGITVLAVLAVATAVLYSLVSNRRFVTSPILLSVAGLIYPWQFMYLGSPSSAFRPCSLLSSFTQRLSMPVIWPNYALKRTAAELLR